MQHVFNISAGLPNSAGVALGLGFAGPTGSGELDPAAMHCMLYGQTCGGGATAVGFPDGGASGLTGRPAAPPGYRTAGFSSGAASCAPPGGFRQDAWMGAAAAAGMNSLQQPAATDAVVVMGLGEDDILACMGGMDAGARRSMLGYASRSQGT